MDECKELCSQNKNCVAFEYGVAYGGGGTYKSRDCQLSDSAEKQGCDGLHHNLDLYVRGNKKRNFSQWVLAHYPINSLTGVGILEEFQKIYIFYRISKCWGSRSEIGRIQFHRQFYHYRSKTWKIARGKPAGKDKC